MGFLAILVQDPECHPPAATEALSSPLPLLPQRAADAGFLTILVQDPEVPGLQVQAADGRWLLVEPIPGALTINVGDQAQVSLTAPVDALPYAPCQLARHSTAWWQGGCWQPPCHHLALQMRYACTRSTAVQVLSNDRFKAPVHRVLASSGRRRYSAPFFFNPAASADIAPLPRVRFYLCMPAP